MQQLEICVEWLMEEKRQAMGDVGTFVSLSRKSKFFFFEPQLNKGNSRFNGAGTTDQEKATPWVYIHQIRSPERALHTSPGQRPGFISTKFGALKGRYIPVSPRDIVHRI